MDILESIYVPHRIYQVVNLTQLQLNRKIWSLVRCRPLECYSVCVFLASVCLLFHSLYTEGNLMRNGLASIVTLMQLSGIRVAHIFSVLESMARRNEQQKFYEKVRELDRIFECSLNVSVDNRSLRRKILKHAIMMLTVYMSIQLFMFGTTPQLYMFWISHLVPFVVCSLHYLQIFTAIWIVKQRFELLIAALEGVNSNKTSQKISIISPPTMKLIQPRVAIFGTTERLNRPFKLENSELQKLFIIRDLYNRLWDLTAILNSRFGISVLINVTIDFVITTTNLYWIFVKLSETQIDFLITVSVAIWAIPAMCKMIVLAILCDRTVQNNTNIVSCLHRIEIYSEHDDHGTVIKQFALQLLHQKINFSAAGFFNIDWTLLYTIFGAIITYLVILIQFHLNEKKKNA